VAGKPALVMWAATSFDLDADVVVRLLGAAVLGGLVGVEREASDQPAGLRTHIAVALGAALFGVISTLGFLEFDQLRANSTVQVDVSRVASNVVVGIGFLGAGVIFRQGGSVRPGVPTDEVIDLFDSDGTVATSELALRKDQGRMVLVSSVSGPPHEVRRWVSRLAARPEIESVNEE